MTKYFRLTATSVTRYSHYIKVPDSFTVDDIWKLQETDHSMFDGGMFTEDKYSSDWEFDDIYVYKKEDINENFKDATEYTTEELNNGN
jgi:hypothetical protein